MKNILTALFLLGSLAAFGQKDIAFAKTEHQFGKVAFNKPVTVVFQYTNKSTKPVVVEFANAECGCTKPEYSAAPIPAGKSSTIKVTYNSAVLGSFKKRVDVKFAHSNQPYILTIEGEVFDPKAVPAATKGKARK
ncbi:MAG: DUF1573 domain-containing protein [Sphingobacteriia bacterium]|jgi:hypothetical protein|nr:MAG: DUF1573 domain-containing protein [Sphingobacteriia bacterium]